MCRTCVSTVRVDESRVLRQRVVGVDVVVVPDSAVAPDLLHEHVADLSDLVGAEEAAHLDDSFVFVLEGDAGG